MPSSRQQVQTLVAGLLGMQTVRSVESKHRKFTAVMKNAVINNSDPTAAKYYIICTSYSANLIAAELTKSKTKAYTVVEGIRRKFFVFQ
jgi:hypothetical protein